jgi:hypothetical protein
MGELYEKGCKIDILCQCKFDRTAQVRIIKECKIYQQPREALQYL